MSIVALFDTVAKNIFRSFSRSFFMIFFTNVYLVKILLLIRFVRIEKIERSVIKKYLMVSWKI